MEQFLFAGLTAREFWASVAILCVVGLTYFGQDVINEDSAKNDTSWRWGDVYRRPKNAPTWGKHGNCACAAALVVSVTLGAMMH